MIRLSGTEANVVWKSKSVSSGSIVTFIITDNSLFQKIKWFEASKICLKLNGSYLKQNTTTFNLANVINLFIVCEIDTWSRDLKADFNLKNHLFRTVELTTNADPNKYSYSGYGIGFDSPSLFSLPNFDWAKNDVIFKANNTSQFILIIRETYLMSISNVGFLYINVQQKD